MLAAALAPSPHALADAPPCRYELAPQTALDRDTNLTWQRALAPGTYTQAQAQLYCQSLTLDGGGFRLPTVQELRTLVDDSTRLPAIDVTAFPDTPQDGDFWTSTISAADPGNAWIVRFQFGFDDTWLTDTPAYVRCVR